MQTQVNLAALPVSPARMLMSGAAYYWLQDAIEGSRLPIACNSTVMVQKGLELWQPYTKAEGAR